LRRGFSYLDVMIAVVIIAIGVTAVMQAMSTTTSVNAGARKTEVAVNLSRHIHEYAMGLTMAKLDALNGRTFTGPIGSDGLALAPANAYSDWGQRVTVSLAPIADIKGSGAGTPATKVRRLVVEARYKGAVVHRESWLIAPVGF
jgi:type II secretory pathway pseudopilin PulG